MNFKRMRIKEILRRIWLLSAIKIKPFESMCKQPSQLKFERNSSLCQIIAAKGLIIIRQNSNFNQSDYETVSMLSLIDYSLLSLPLLHKALHCY